MNNEQVLRLIKLLQITNPLVDAQKFIECLSNILGSSPNLVSNGDVKIADWGNRNPGSLSVKVIRCRDDQISLVTLLKYSNFPGMEAGRVTIMYTNDAIFTAHILPRELTDLDLNNENIAMAVETLHFH